MENDEKNSNNKQKQKKFSVVQSVVCRCKGVEVLLYKIDTTILLYCFDCEICDKRIKHVRQTERKIVSSDLYKKVMPKDIYEWTDNKSTIWQPFVDANRHRNK